MIDEKLKERLDDVINVAIDDYLSAESDGKNTASKTIVTLMEERRKIAELEQAKLDADNKLEAEIDRTNAELTLKTEQMQAELERVQAEMDFKRDSESKNQKILIASSIGVPVVVMLVKEMFKMHFCEKISDYENRDCLSKTPTKSVKDWFSWR